ncbi:MAG: hypothetical protein IJJ99_08560 [Oscillospiraceae bacterium]|nr:hypothetical protein [Oscillospiraceae bacterium]
MKKVLRSVLSFLKKEPMLVAAVAAAVAALFITPPRKELLESIDWKTLATLFMLLSVLDGFKHENLFRPVIRVVGSIRSLLGVSFFLVFGVFFSSMFVTNDVSLIIFVPLTMLLFRAYGKEQYILPVLTMENVAAIRGSLLTPFGSPQNLFLFSNSGTDTGSFLRMMLPLWLGSIVLIALFLLFLFRRELKQPAAETGFEPEPWKPEGRVRRIVYLVLFAVIIACIVTRTPYWYYVTAFVTVVLLIFDRRVFLRVDYVLLLTFLCFFIFSSSVAANETIAGFLKNAVAGHEYWWSIGISQIISNVPAAIVLWPFTTALKPLIYGLDTAGLVSIIGSLASVINLRLYTREYPGQGKKFLLVFEKISLCFFAIVVLLQLLLL